MITSPEKYAKVTVTVEVDGKIHTRTYPRVELPQLVHEPVYDEYLPYHNRPTVRHLTRALNFTVSGTAYRDENDVMCLEETTEKMPA